MSTKKEEAKAYKKLKDVFPTKNVSLDCRHESWYEEVYYIAYVADMKPSPFSKQYSTVMEAVNEMIKRKEEETNAVKEVTSVDEL